MVMMGCATRGEEGSWSGQLTVEEEEAAVSAQRPGAEAMTAKCGGTMRWRVRYDDDSDGQWTEDSDWACPEVCESEAQEYTRQVQCQCVSTGQILSMDQCQLDVEGLAGPMPKAEILCLGKGPCGSVILGMRLPKALHHRAVWALLAAACFIGCLVSLLLCWCCKRCCCAPKTPLLKLSSTHQQVLALDNVPLGESFSEESSLVDVTMTTYDGGGGGDMSLGGRGGTGGSFQSFEHERSLSLSLSSEEDAPLVVRGAV